MSRLVMALMMALTACGDAGVAAVPYAEAVAVPYGVGVSGGAVAMRGDADVVGSVLAPGVSASCGAGAWVPFGLKPLGGDVVWGLGRPPVAEAWRLQTVTGNTWRTTGSGVAVLFELIPQPLRAGEVLVVRKVRVRANSTQVGDFVEVTLKRRDLNGHDLNMSSWSPAQLDLEIDEISIVPDQDNVLRVDPDAPGPSSHSIMLLVRSNGDDGTIYEFEGADVFVEICDE